MPSGRRSCISAAWRALQIGEEGTRHQHAPRAADRPAFPLDPGDERAPEELIVDQPSGEPVAEPVARAPCAGDIDALPPEVRVPEQHPRDGRRLCPHVAADHHRRLVDRPHLDVHRPAVALHHEHVGLGDERLRAQDALGFGATQLLAAVARAEQEEPLDDVRLRRLVDRPRDVRHDGHAAEARHRRRLGVDDQLLDVLPVARHQASARRRGRRRRLLRRERERGHRHERHRSQQR
jgi:hypothetical protein